MLFEALIQNSLELAADIAAHSTPCCALLRQVLVIDAEHIESVLQAPYMRALGSRDAEGILVEATTRVWQAGQKYRRETLGGLPLRISDGVTGWHFAYYPGEYGYHPDDEELTATMTRRPLPAVQFQIPPIIPPEERDLSPIGDPELVPHGGHDAWIVTMARAQTDRSPGLKYTIDAGTGFLLRSQSTNSGYLSEWLELAVGCEIDDELFRWTGPSRPGPGPQVSAQ